MELRHPTSFISSSVSCPSPSLSAIANILAAFSISAWPTSPSPSKSNIF